MPLTVLTPTWGREEFTARLRKSVGGPLVTFAASWRMEEFHVQIWEQAKKITTPFVMLADSDDLLVNQGCEEILDTFHLDNCVAAYGRIGGFKTRGNKPNSTVTRRTRNYTPFGLPESYLQDDPKERILAGFANESLYYAIHRIDAFVDVWSDMAALKFDDYQLASKFYSMRLLKMGRVRALPWTYYLRQYNTYVDFPHRFSFPGRLMTNHFSSHREVILGLICGVDLKFKEELRTEWIKWWEAYFRRNYGCRASMRRFIKGFTV